MQGNKINRYNTKTFLIDTKWYFQVSIEINLLIPAKSYLKIKYETVAKYLTQAKIAFTKFIPIRNKSNLSQFLFY